MDSYAHSIEILGRLFYNDVELAHDIQKLESFECDGIIYKNED